MAQCEKVLDDGKQCSNQAVPGARYCQTHGRIVFRPAQRPADTAPPGEPLPPPTTPAAKQAAKATPPPPAWQAAPSPAKAAPVFPGLRNDARAILVAPEGVIWLEAGAPGEAQTPFTRLVRLLGLLSQAMNLPGQVKVFTQGDKGDCLIRLTPEKDNVAHLSVFYDAAAAAARLVDGRLYIGAGNACVQYRDDGAPRGYDVAGFTARHDSAELLLVAHWGSRLLPLDKFAEMPLAETCCRIAPLPGSRGPLPEQVFVLTPPVLYRVLAHYLREHRLRYRLAQLVGTDGGTILFEVSPRPDAATGRGVPAFVLDYLERLPRVAVLATAHEAGAQRFLLQWRHDYPLALAHIAAAFEANELVILSAGRQGNLRVAPAPEFFDGDGLVSVHARQPAIRTFRPQSAGTPTLQLPVQLRPDAGPLPPVAALLLSRREVGWLRQLLYRVPGAALESYLVCVGEGETGAILLGGGRPIAGIPFGAPLRRVGDTPLFIPLRRRLAPDLSPAALYEVLGLRDDVYTLLTDEQRLEAPAKAFRPLSQSVMADPKRPPVKLTLQATSLPPLVWRALPAGDRPATSGLSEPPQPGRKGDSWLSRIWGAVPSGDQGQPEAAPVAKPTMEEAPEPDWRRQAGEHEEAGDFLAAAVCYSLLGDAVNGARCYRRATESGTDAQKAA